MNDKQLERLEKTLGEETLAEMEAMSEEELKKAIVDANSSMKQVQEELDANPKYQEIKENLKAITQGKKDVNKRQRARIQYSLHLLESKGK